MKDKVTISQPIGQKGKTKSISQDQLFKLKKRKFLHSIDVWPIGRDMTALSFVDELVGAPKERKSGYIFGKRPKTTPNRPKKEKIRALLCTNF